MELLLIEVSMSLVLVYQIDTCVLVYLIVIVYICIHIVMIVTTYAVISSRYCVHARDFKINISTNND